MVAHFELQSEEPKVEAGQRKGNVIAKRVRLNYHKEVISQQFSEALFILSSHRSHGTLSGLVGAKLQSSFARPVWPKTELRHRKALRRCRQLGLTSFQEVDLFKTDVIKRCGKFQTKMDIQASLKLQPSAQWKPKISSSWPVMALGCARAWHKRSPMPRKAWVLHGF